MFWLVFDVLIFIVVPIFIGIFSGKNSKDKKRKFGRILVYGLTIIMLIVMIFPLISQATDLETSEKTVADGIEIDKYTIKLDVDEKQKVSVEEDITINFTEYGHHGIYKFTPEWLRYTSKEGKTIRRKSTVTDLRTDIPPYKGSEIPEYYDDALKKSIESLNESRWNSTYDYTIDVVNKKKRIKIGSSLQTIPEGQKDYIIKYDYDMGSDPYKGYDEFIFHAYGDFWGTEIKEPSIEVTMPKSIEGNKVHFFIDKYRKLDVTKAVDYTITDNKLVAKFNKDKYSKLAKKDSNYPSYLDRSLTVDIELPDNFFINGSFNYGYKSLTCIIICILIMITSFVLWLLFGKDYDKKLAVVNYMPPRGLSAAEIGYINSNNYSSKLVISLIVELASKKMITIRENKDGEILIKGIKPSPTSKDYDKKKKEYDEKVKSLNEYEQIVLKELIKGSSEVHLKKHQTFYKVFDQIDEKLDKEYRWVINEKISYVLKYVSLALVNIAAVLMFSAYRYFEDLSLNLYNLYYVGFVSVFITLFFSLFMSRKSRYGEDLEVEVSGFKDFLKLVEKDKLEELVEKIPDYFYQILPYTYALNISKKWIEKFEDIKMPETKLQDIDMRVFDDITSQIYTPAPVVTHSSGCSSCSSCGGGCSSCGGGCSSCGGGGSW